MARADSTNNNQAQIVIYLPLHYILNLLFHLIHRPLLFGMDLQPNCPTLKWLRTASNMSRNPYGSLIEPSLNLIRIRDHVF